MPLANPAQQFRDATGLRVVPEPAESAAAQPGWADIGKAAYALTNTMAAYGRSAAGQHGLAGRYEGAEAPVKGYNPLEDPAIADLEGDEILDVALSQSPAETRRLVNIYRENRAHQKTLAGSGWRGVAASVAAGVLDPVTAVGFAVPVAAPVAWGSRAKRVAAGVSAAVGIDAATEMVLHSQQPLRTWEESAVNVGAGALLTGILGHIATRVPKSEFEILREQVRRDLKGAPDQPSVGAAYAGGGPFQWGGITIDDLDVDTTAGRFLAASLGRISPTLRAMRSPVLEVRKLLMESVHLPWNVKGNVAGTVVNPNALETAVHRAYNTEIAGLLQAEQDLYRTYVQRAKAAGETPLSRRAFGREATWAAYDGQTAIPEAAKLGSKLRGMYDEHRRVLDELMQASGEGGFKGLDNYVTQQWDPVVIRQRLTEFDERMKQFIRDNPLLPEETPDIQKARTLAAAEGDIADPENLASVVASRGAREAAAEAGEAVRKNTARMSLLSRELRAAENAADDLARQLESVTEQRAALREDMSGATPEQLAKTEAKLDREIERIREKAIRADDLRARKQQEAVEAEQAHADLRATAKDARKAYKEAAKAAKEARKAAATVRDYEKRLEAARNIQRDDAEIKAEAMRIRDEILGTHMSVMHSGSTTNPRVMRERKLHINQRDFADFLVRDFDQVSGTYLRSMIPEIQSRRLGLGPKEWEARITEIKDRFKVKQAAETDPVKREKLRVQESKTVEDLEAIRARIMNRVGPTGQQRYMPWVRAVRLARSYNYMRLLGSQTLSSLSDIAHTMTRYGAPKTAKMLAKLIVSPEFRKLSKAQAQRVGAATQAILDQRVGTMADIADPLTRGRGFVGNLERGMDVATSQFTRFTLMSGWNQMVQTLAVALEGDTLLRAARNYEKLSAFKKGQFAAAGFGPDEMARLAQMPVDDIDGLLRAGTEAWPDRELAEKFEKSMLEAAEVMTIVRGAGDLPLLMDSELAKTVFQFKSFGMAAVNRIMIPVAQGLSYGDAASASGAAMMLALGGLTYASKELAAGREITDDPGRLMAEAATWSGLLGYATDVTDPVKMIAPQLFPFARTSRYASRGKVETLLGPTIGTGSDLFSALTGIAGPTSEEDKSPSLTASDLHAIRKLAPYQNHPAIRRLLNALEGEAAEALGVQGATPGNFVERITRTEEAR